MPKGIPVKQPDDGERTPPGQLLIYIDGGLNLQVRLDGLTVWLSQRLIAELFQVSVPTVSEHLSGIYNDAEIDPEATIRKFRIVQRETTRDVTRLVDHYSLEAILAVGYRVRSARGTQFRQWATTRLSELLAKGFILDDERIKAGQTIGHDYFDELLERIRAIRASERLFYQKVTDIYATSIDYDSKAEISREFFSTVQNKLHFAIHGRTAAEVVRFRADASKPAMGLTTWKNAPNGPVRKRDIDVAKNYLTSEEASALNLIVTMYLDYAEDQARRNHSMHMADWVTKLDAFLQFNEREILSHQGRIQHKQAVEFALGEFAKYEESQRATEVSESTSDFDRVVAEAKRLRGESTG